MSIKLSFSVSDNDKLFQSFAKRVNQDIMIQDAKRFLTFIALLTQIINIDVIVIVVFVFVVIIT